MVFMIKIFKKDIPFEKSLEQRLEFICEFCKTLLLSLTEALEKSINLILTM